MHAFHVSLLLVISHILNEVIPYIIIYNMIEQRIPHKHKDSKVTMYSLLRQRPFIHPKTRCKYILILIKFMATVPYGMMSECLRLAVSLLATSYIEFSLWLFVSLSFRYGVSN